VNVRASVMTSVPNCFKIFKISTMEASGSSEALRLLNETKQNQFVYHIMWRHIPVGFNLKTVSIYVDPGSRGSIVGWGIMPQAGKGRGFES
jgi:hypothetical protein